MRRIVCFLVACLLLLGVFPYSVQAESEAGIDTEYPSDGGYIITELVNPGARDASQTKVKTYYNSNDVAEWKITLVGTFRYNGSAATCTGATCDVEIYTDDWYLISKSASFELATASCEVTLGQKLLGVTVGTPTYELSLTCIRYGVYI